MISVYLKWQNSFILKNMSNCKLSHINVNGIRHKFEQFRIVLIENITRIQK